MALYRGGSEPSAIYRGDQPVSAVYRGDIEVWRPVVHITGTSGYQSRDQFRQACIAYGTTYQTVQVLPFLLDTSQATSMNSMFEGCSSLTQAPDLDTANVTGMGYMFRDCSSLTQAPDLDTAKVTNMSVMFSGCSALHTVPDLDTSNVTNMGYMFYGCSGLTDWDVRLIGKHPSVTTTSMISMSNLSREPFLGAEGTIAGRTLTSNSLTTLATRTITAAEGSNLKLLRMTLAWGNATATKSIRIDRNGVQVATATGQNPVATTEVVCNVGDVITYKATVNSTTTANRVINSGTWGAWTR